ncbi:hypothetical protein EPYR_03136 [Erwinia pyrifoliae DSM 12163]|nr:hypothetical protein EPYR_03136 [Erwinia pyrifoliae DSM 12163]
MQAGRQAQRVILHRILPGLRARHCIGGAAARQASLSHKGNWLAEEGFATDWPRFYFTLDLKAVIVFFAL